jgi:CAAX protease family protein
MTELAHERYPLDHAVAAELRDPTVRWGIGQVALVILGFYAVLVVDGALVLGAHLPAVAFSIVGYAGQVGVIYLAARPALRGEHPWAGAFGWERPRRADAVPIVLWLVAAAVAQIMVGAVLTVLIPALRDQDLSNVDFGGLSTASIVALAVIGIVIAPAIEELTYRGIALRGIMRRYGFMPAAIVTSLLFGISHAYEESTIVGAVFITVQLSVFGFLQCWLVRKTGRLGPAIVTHAVHNAVAFAIALGMH